MKKQNSLSPTTLTQDHKLLVQWYKANKRDLPWRQSRDPYRIWLSEVMLQQTTVAAVVPYFERFLKRFPQLKDLASASEHEVIEAWAGLGYYSRARNLHKASKVLADQGFPRTWQELIELPGFGPYTSRAVASIAFDQCTGVLDGNVIRVLSRKYGQKIRWWEPKERESLQQISDSLADHGESSSLNQGLMELGATICTPQKPACLLCPWKKDCIANHEGRVDTLPLKKPRRQSEIWIWNVEVIFNTKKQIALIENNYLPFLKGKPTLPGKIKISKEKPRQYTFKHAITHHEIFVSVKSIKKPDHKNIIWVNIEDLKKINPSSVLQKILRATQIN